MDLYAVKNKSLLKMDNISAQSHDWRRNLLESKNSAFLLAN